MGIRKVSMVRPNDLRKKLLAERGIVVIQTAKNIHHKLVPATTIQLKTKTAKMMYLEIKYGKRIEDVLSGNSLRQAAKIYGNEVDFTTLSKWIDKYKIKYSESNLPACAGCKCKHPTCDAVAQCNLLVELGMYDLIDAKRRELVGE